MAKIIKEGKHVYWVDGNGQKTPQNRVHEEDKARDKAVSRLVNRAKKLQAVVAAEKAAMETELLAYLGEAARREGEDWVGGAKLYSYSMDQSVTIKVAKRWTFDERLQIAKQKIDKCIENWSKGASSKLMAIVNRAFRVDQAGNVDAKQILMLRTIKMDDALWQEAMDLISDSMKLMGTKAYFYFQEADEDGKHKSIVLDFSAL